MQENWTESSLSIIRTFGLKKIEEKIIESENVSDFNMAVRKLNETLNNNTLDQEKCFYILRVLEKLVPVMKEKNFTVRSKADSICTV